MNKEQLSKLLGKLRTPVHVDYIAKYILNTSIEETRKELNQLLVDGLIEESKYAKDYYSVKKEEKNEN